jgi:hypothetical protein
MIKTPYGFEANLTDQDFQKIGQFACRWSHIEHTMANCLRRLLDLTPEEATIMAFSLSLDQRTSRMAELIEKNPLPAYQAAVFVELRPLIRTIQYIRNTILHGVVIDLFPDEEAFFHLRSKGREITKTELLSCEDLINYTAHVAQAFRLSLGEKEAPSGHTYALPDRPPLPEFLRDKCNLPKEDKAMRQSRPETWVEITPWQRAVAKS